MITAAIVDNGEPLLERSLWSLRNQTVPVDIIVAAGPQTNMELAEKHADKVMEPMAGIGQARVAAILKASTPYILSCDSDTIYDSKYAENALRDLRMWKAAQGTSINPLDGRQNLVEQILQPLQLVFPYEFSLAFRKKEFLNAGIHKVDYSYDKRDIGPYVKWGLLPIPDPRMKCWTRYPTYAAKLALEYAPSILLALSPIAIVASVPVVNELLKRS